MSGSQRELQQMSQQLNIIQRQLQELSNEQESLRATRKQLTGAIDALERLESGSTVQVPLGASTYVRAEIEDVDEVLVAIGADYSAERSRDGAIETLSDRQEIVEDRIENVAEHIAELESEAAELEQQAQRLAQAEQLGSMGPD